MRPRAHVPAVLATILALAVAACAPSPRRASEFPGTPGDEVLAEEPPAAEDAAAQLEDLKRRIPAVAPGEAESLRLRAAWMLEALGRPDDARIEYLGLAGAADPAVAAQAWDAVARLAAQAGDADGALRAQLRALSVSPADGRDRRANALAASLAQADAGTLRAVSRAAAGTPAQDLVARQLDARAPAGSERVVALLLPLTGRFENFGRAFRLGAEIALADRQSGSGAHARPIRAVFLDTAGELATGTRAAREAIVERGAVALIGPLLSVPALGAAALADAFRVPLVAPMATDPAVRTAGRHVLPLDPPARDLIEPLAATAVDVLGARRFGALVPRDPAAEERERAFREAVESRRAEFVLSVAYDPGERDFRKLLELLEEAALDAVYVPGEAPDLEALVPQLEFYGFAPRLLGHGGWTAPKVLRPGTGNLDGTLLSVQAVDDPASDFARHLRSEVERVDGAEPTRFHVQGYRSMASVLWALDRGASDPEALGEMLRLRPFWPERPPGEDVRLLVLQDGALVPATPETLAPPGATAEPDTAGAP